MTSSVELRVNLRANPLGVNPRLTFRANTWSLLSTKNTLHTFTSKVLVLSSGDHEFEFQWCHSYQESKITPKSALREGRLAFSLSLSTVSYSHASLSSASVSSRVWKWADSGFLRVCCAAWDGWLVSHASEEAGDGLRPHWCRVKGETCQVGGIWQWLNQGENHRENVIILRSLTSLYHFFLICLSSGERLLYETVTGVIQCWAVWQ